MIALASVALVALLSLPGNSQPPSPAESLLVPPSGVDRPAYRPGELIVRFKASADRERASDVIVALGSGVVRSARYVPGLHVVTVPPGMTLQQAIAAYAGRPDVQYAEPNYLDYPFFIPNDPRFDEQWHLQKIGCSTAWDRTRGVPEVIVALIDTGVAFIDRPGHPMAPDLAGTRFVMPWDAVDGDTEPLDDVNHGTHVCGTIAQTTNNGVGVAGVAPLCSIMPIRSLGPGGGSHEQFADACHYAADNGAQLINYSAGGSASRTKQEAIKYAFDKGVLICAAMGNEGVLNSADAYPGRYPEVIGVAASTIEDKRAWYSNYGEGVGLTGPGGDSGTDLDGNGQPDEVLQNTFPSYQPGGPFGYRYMIGTSMATPHVTGAAALVYSEIIRRGSTPTRDQVRTLLEQTAQDLGAPGQDNRFGYGLVRVDRALEALGGPPPTVEWVGTPRFAEDGVYPDQAIADTPFQFRVRYKDPEGKLPVTAALQIQKLTCGGAWQLYREKGLTARHGSLTGGKVYSCSAALPNAVYRYRFDMAGPSGPATGAPADWTLGPMVVGNPFLCWSQVSGFGTDGVKPNSGPAGATFTFRVQYMDSRGNFPQTRNLVLRRNGSRYGTFRLRGAAGALKTGRDFGTRLKLSGAGTYEYRFEFADGSGPATGAPTKWRAGPSVTGPATALHLTGLTAAQTGRGGAQLAFTLTAPAAVTVRMLSVAGREVRTVVSGRALPAGTTTVLWDGRSSTGLPVPAGVYLVRVSAADGSGAVSSALAILTLRR